MAAPQSWPGSSMCFASAEFLVIQRRVPMLGIHWAGLDLSPVGRAGRPTYRGDNCWSASSPRPELEDRCSDSRASEPVGQQGFPGGRTGRGGGGGRRHPEGYLWS